MAADSTNQSRFLNPWNLHLQKLGLELKCPLCLVLFQKPVLLPCDHIFCKSCISASTEFKFECLVCKEAYLDQDLRAAPFMENMVTIYKSMESTLHASLYHSTASEKQPSSSVTGGFGIKWSTEPFETCESGKSRCGHRITTVMPKKRLQANHSVENGTVENEKFGRRNNGSKEFENCKVPPSSSGLIKVEGHEECEIPNMSQMTHSSSGSPPSFGDIKGFDGENSDRGSEHSPQKYSSKRPMEKNSNNRAGQNTNDSVAPGTEDSQTRDFKRQKKLNYGFLETSEKNDSHHAGCTIYNPGSGPKCEGSLSGAQLPLVLDDVKSHCGFCQSSNISEATGPILHYANGKLVAGDDICRSNVIHVHKKCIEWAPQVYYVEEVAKNLEKELARGGKLKCSSCGIKGAALGCYAKKCKRSYHVPCAVKDLDCRWDCENYLLLCPTHSKYRFPNEKSKPAKSVFNKNPLPVSMTLEQSRFWAASSNGVKEWVLCGSALTAEEKFLLIKFAGMSGITVSKFWNPNVTHVIAATDVNGAFSRTVKVLMAILQGKWILTIDWIKACMEAMHPVDEERYEISIDNHGCRDGPKTGRLRVLANEPKLLSGFQFYFSGDFLHEYLCDLKNLVIAAGGTVLDNREEFCKLVHDAQVTPTTFVVFNLDTSQGCKVGEEYTVVSQRFQEAEKLADEIGSRVIGHTWLLESLAACKLQPFA